MRLLRENDGDAKIMNVKNRLPTNSPFFPTNSPSAFFARFSPDLIPRMVLDMVVYDSVVSSAIV